MGNVRLSNAIEKGATGCVFDRVSLPEGKQHFKIAFDVAGKKVMGGKDADGDAQGPVRVTFTRLDGE